MSLSTEIGIPFAVVLLSVIGIIIILSYIERKARKENQFKSEK